MENKIRVLSVAGPRASEEAEIGEFVKLVLTNSLLSKTVDAIMPGKLSMKTNGLLTWLLVTVVLGAGTGGCKAPESSSVTKNVTETAGLARPNGTNPSVQSVRTRVGEFWFEQSYATVNLSRREEAVEIETIIPRPLELPIPQGLRPADASRVRAAVVFAGGAMEMKPVVLGPSVANAGWADYRYVAKFSKVEAKTNRSGGDLHRQ
jgi:hypothetical protein